MDHELIKTDEYWLSITFNILNKYSLLHVFKDVLRWQFFKSIIIQSSYFRKKTEIYSISKIQTIVSSTLPPEK